MNKLNSVDSIDSSSFDQYLTENEFEEPTIPLKTGLDVRKLTLGTEFVIKDDEDFVPEEKNLNYFNNEELLKALNQECLYFQNEDDDENNNDDFDDDKSPFEKMMKTMTPIVENQIFKKELKTGSGKELPNKALVTIHYNAYLEYSDEPFDSTRLRGTPLKFVLGDNRVVEGLDIAVATMKNRETSQFLIKPLYAYGEMGCPPRIPPSATILYEVELLSFLDNAPAVEYEELSPEEKKQLPFNERLRVVRSEHEAANDYFNQDNHYKALNKYKKVVKLIDNINVANEEEDNQRNNYLLKLYLNISLCYLKQHEYKFTVIYAKKALNIDSKNTKGNFRCGKALRNLGEFAESKKYLERARERDPSNKEINEELKKLSSQEVRYLALEKKFCKNIFNSSNKNDDDDERPAFNYEVNDEFKSTITDCMKKLIDDDKQQEIPFSSGFSPSEIACIKQIAKEFGLYYVEQKIGPIKQIKVTKLNPSK